jgi:predicted trehalose synthase
LNPRDVAEALRRFHDAAYTMRYARRRYRAEATTNARDLSFRAWARKAFNPPGCAGKLLDIVSGKERGL